MELEVSMGKSHWIVIPALAAAAATISTSAAAYTSVGVQIGVPATVYGQPVYAPPVYPQAVYPHAVYPQAVYPQPVYVQPAAVAVYPPVVAHRAWARPAYIAARGWHDRAGDGVPNRYDRAPRDPYRY